MPPIPVEVRYALCLQIYMDIRTCQTEAQANAIESPSAEHTFGAIGKARGLTMKLDKKWVRNRAKQFAIYNEESRKDGTIAKSLYREDDELAVDLGIDPTDRHTLDHVHIS